MTGHGTALCLQLVWCGKVSNEGSHTYLVEDIIT